MFEPSVGRSGQTMVQVTEQTVIPLRYRFNYVPVHRTILRSRQRLNLCRSRVGTAEPPVFQQFLLYV
jgi:hypothetical protein